MKAIFIETDDEYIIELLLDAMKCRRESYHRQQHTIANRYDKVVSDIKVMDNDGKVTSLNLLK